MYDDGRIAIKNIFKHPGFQFKGANIDDIALLQLETPLNFEKNPNISPGCLDMNEYKFNYGSNLLAVGHGLQGKVFKDYYTGEKRKTAPISRLKIIK